MAKAILQDIGQTYKPVGLEFNVDVPIMCNKCGKGLAIFKCTIENEPNIPCQVKCYDEDCKGASEVFLLHDSAFMYSGYHEEGNTPEDVKEITYLEPLSFGRHVKRINTKKSQTGVMLLDDSVVEPIIFQAVKLKKDNQ